MAAIRKAGLAAIIWLAATFGAGAPAMAQQTAEGLLQQFTAPSGYGHLMQYRTLQRTGVWDPALGEWWDGIEIEIVEGTAQGHYTAVLAIVRNLSGREYCMRPVYALDVDQGYGWEEFMDPGQTIYLIPAGADHPILFAHSAGPVLFDMVADAAFWRPDHSRARACTDVAPDGVGVWADAYPTSDALPFYGSRR